MERKIVDIKAEKERIVAWLQERKEKNQLQGRSTRRFGRQGQHDGRYAVEVGLG